MNESSLLNSEKRMSSLYTTQEVQGIQVGRASQEAEQNTVNFA